MEFRKPVILDFKAYPKQVREKDFIVVSWKTEFAKYVYLNGIHVSSNGTREIPAAEKITIKASNGSERVEKNIKIKVIHALDLYEFWVDEDNIQIGKDCIVTWKGRYIKRVIFEGEELSPDGPIVFKPTRSSYEVLFEGEDGETIKKTFVVHKKNDRGCLLLVLFFIVVIIVLLGFITK